MGKVRVIVIVRVRFRSLNGYFDVMKIAMIVVYDVWVICCWYDDCL